MRSVDTKSPHHVALSWGLRCRQSMGKVVCEKCRIVSSLHDAIAEATQQSTTNRALLERVALHRHLYASVFEECSYASIWSDVDQVSGVWVERVEWYREGIVPPNYQRRPTFHLPLFSLLTHVYR